jgi:ferredoxin
MGIPTLKQAKVRDLWPREIKYPLLSPKDVKYDNFVLPSTAGYLLTGKKEPNRSPLPNENCTACGQCIEICPKKAIKIDKIAKIDYSNCIKCYCCHEVCAYDAIKLETFK